MNRLLKHFLQVINIIFVVGCLVHVGLNGYYILYPPLPEIKVYQVDLKNMDFPLTFKLCVTERENSYERYEKLGYRNDFNFFIGRSRHNRSLFGWNGHTENGSTLGGTASPSRQNFVCFVRSRLKCNTAQHCHEKIKEINYCTTTLT